MNKCASQLKDEGYIIEKAKKIRWAQQDFFGLWDIIAIHPLTKEIRFIQVSAKPDYDKGILWRANAAGFPAEHKEYWWGKGREWVIKSL